MNHLSRPVSAEEVLTDVIQNKALHSFEAALSCQACGDFEKSIFHISKAITLQPGEARYFALRAECFLCLTDLQSAILNYRRASSLQTDNAVFKCRLAFLYGVIGQIFYNQKQFLQAWNSFQRATELRPDVEMYNYRMLACLAALDRHKECLDQVNLCLNSASQMSCDSQDIAEIGPASNTDLIKYSPTAVENECLSISQESTESIKVTRDLYLLRARLHRFFGYTAMAFYDVKCAIDRDPHHPEALSCLQALEVRAAELKDDSVRLTLLGRHDHAVQSLSVAIENNPIEPDLHVLRGAVYRRKGDYNTAIDDFLLALDKTQHDAGRPTFSTAQHQLLLTYNDFALECCRKGFFDEAITLLDKAINCNRLQKGLYLNRGDCFYHRGDIGFALADYMQAAEMDPSDINIAKRISRIHYESAVELFQDKKYQDAEQMLTKAIDVYPWSSDYYSLRCKTRMLCANEEAARKDAVCALTLNPSNKEVRQTLAKLFHDNSVVNILKSPSALQIRSELLAHDTFSTTQSSRGLDDSCLCSIPGFIHLDDTQTSSSKDCQVRLQSNRQLNLLHPTQKQITSVYSARKINRLVQDALENTQNLKSSNLLLRSSQSPMAKSSHRSKQGLRLDVSHAAQQPGWRQFV